MALDAIIIGCDWLGVITVGPTSGKTEAEVTDDLTGATALAGLYDGETKVATFGVSIDAPTRKIALSLSNAVTGTLAPRDNLVFGLQITTANARVLPVGIPERVAIRLLT